MVTDDAAATNYDVVIVGTGHAGAKAASALRQAKFNGSIALLGEEPDLPYERPPLSKDYLSGEKSHDRLLIHPANFWPQRDIVLLLGRRVTVIDPQERRVYCADATTICYRHLVWATGGVPRRLACAGHDLMGVHTLRTRADADSMRGELPKVRRAVVIGGGYIGLEAAAVLTGAGKHVTVLEAQDRLLSRVSGEAISRFYEAEHRAHGVDVRLGAHVACIEGADGHVSGVRLANGEVVACDMVVVGIGIVPAVDQLLAAGAVGINGVAVDSQCRTSLPCVFAIGDCALHANVYADGAMIRLESVQNANDQATVVASVLTGRSTNYDAVPWFWSNQYDLRLQTVGLSAGHDQTVTRGDPSTRSFSVAYLRRGKVIAFDCLNAMKDFVQGKQLVIAGVFADPALLADVNVALKAMVE